MRNICVVVTARPSWSRIKTACEAIREHPDLTLTLVLAGSACAMVDEIRRQGFESSAEVPILRGKYTKISMAKTASTGVHELATLFENFDPDVVLTVADRYETLATAVAASYLGVPLAHTQGGECTGSIDNKVRNAVTQLADYHFVSTEKARNRVTQMKGLRDVYLTGCPAIDLAAREGFDPCVRPNPYAVIMLHPDTRETNEVGYERIRHIVQAIEDCRMEGYLVGPNLDAGAMGIKQAIWELVGSDHPLIQTIKPKTPEEFLQLVGNCGVLIGNSSMGIRECSFMGIPAINIGARQEGRECGLNVLHLYHTPSRDAIRRSIDIQLKVGRYQRSTLYGDGTAGKQIAECLSCVSLA